MCNFFLSRVQSVAHITYNQFQINTGISDIMVRAYNYLGPPPKKKERNEGNFSAPDGYGFRQT